jgi:integrase
LVEVTPFKRGTEPVVKLRPELKRSRRLEPGEAAPSLAACADTLRPIVEAALETGCRRGELLSLQWHQVRLDARGEIFLPGQKTKTNRDRRIPISTRLRAILEMRRHDCDGEAQPPEAYVFGDPATGQRVRSFTRAWEAAILRGHGVQPRYLKKLVAGRTVWTSVLSPDCRAELHQINLHFHDLRREAGSRWLDGGVPLTAIRD